MNGMRPIWTGGRYGWTPLAKHPTYSYYAFCLLLHAMIMETLSKNGQTSVRSIASKGAYVYLIFKVNYAPSYRRIL